MFYYRRKSLRDSEYTNSSTYRKYHRYVGKLVSFTNWLKYETDALGLAILDEDNKPKSIYQQKLYLITSVVPMKYYSNRFAFKLSAVGDHADQEIGSSDLLKKLKKDAKRGWEIVNG